VVRGHTYLFFEGQLLLEHWKSYSGGSQKTVIFIVIPPTDYVPCDEWAIGSQENMTGRPAAQPDCREATLQQQRQTGEFGAQKLTDEAPKVQEYKKQKRESWRKVCALLFI
jgi:hypothetical protein